MKLRAIGPKVIIKVKKLETKTSGGIYLPDSSMEKEQMAVTEGVLLAKGPTAFDYLPEGTSPEIGDTVHFVKYAGINKEVDDEFYRIVNDEDVFSVGDLHDIETN